MKRLFVVLMMSFLLVILVFGNDEKKDPQKQQEMETKTDSQKLKYLIVVTATRTEQPKLELGSSTTLIPFSELKKAFLMTMHYHCLYNFWFILLFSSFQTIC